MYTLMDHLGPANNLLSKDPSFRLSLSLIGLIIQLFFIKIRVISPTAALILFTMSFIQETKLHSEAIKTFKCNTDVMQ